MAFGGILHLHPDTVLLMFSSCGELGHSEFTMLVASDFMIFMSGFIGPWTYLVSMFFVSYSGRLVSDDDEVVVVSSCTQMGHTCKRTSELAHTVTYRLSMANHFP